MLLQLFPGDFKVTQLFSGYEHRHGYQSLDDYNPKGYQPPARHRQPEPFTPPRFDSRWDQYYKDRQDDRNYWGFTNGYAWGSYGNVKGQDSHYGSRNYHGYDQRNYDAPRPQQWGLYGGSYGSTSGYGYGHNEHNSYDYFGFDRYNNDWRPQVRGNIPGYVTAIGENRRVGGADGYYNHIKEGR